MIKNYKVTLKSGVEKIITRDESDGKNLIGFWKWSLGRVENILFDFEECTILSSEIAMIEKIQLDRLLKGAEEVEEKAKDYWENVQDEDDLAAEPADYGC